MDPCRRRSCRSRIRQLLCYRPEAGRSLSCARESKGYAMAFARIAAAAGMMSMLIGTTTVRAAEIVVVSTVAIKESLIEIVPLFERASGHKINITFGNGPTVFEQVRAGATGDLFLGPDEFSDPLLKDRKSTRL